MRRTLARLVTYASARLTRVKADGPLFEKRPRDVWNAARQTNAHIAAATGREGLAGKGLWRRHGPTLDP